MMEMGQIQFQDVQKFWKNANVVDKERIFGILREMTLMLWTVPIQSKQMKFTYIPKYISTLSIGL